MQKGYIVNTTMNKKKTNLNVDKDLFKQFSVNFFYKFILGFVKLNDIKTILSLN